MVTEVRALPGFHLLSLDAGKEARTCLLGWLVGFVLSQLHPFQASPNALAPHGAAGGAEEREL